jgi:hypothetical protein
VQLEPGAACTPFEMPGYSDDLQRCMRYFECSHGPVSALPGSGRSPNQLVLPVAVSSGSYAIVPCRFLVPKRVYPANTLLSVSTGATGKVYVAGADNAASVADQWVTGFAAIQNNSGATWSAGSVIYPGWTSDADF